MSVGTILGATAAAAAAFAVANNSGKDLGLPPPLFASILLSVFCYFLSSHMILAASPIFVKARLFGIDLNKPTTKRDANGVLVRPYEGPVVPEAMGAVACTVYLVAMFAFTPIPFMHDFSEWGSNIGGAWRSGPSPPPAAPSGWSFINSSPTALSTGAAPAYSFPHAHLSKYLCALLAICCMCFLGFADNVLDLRWRDRLWLPLAASLPLLMVYAVDGGGTTVVLPKLFVPSFGPSLRLGLAYYFFMSCLAIFCTNSINILAGVNGLEVGQSVIIAATVLLNNAIQLWRWPEGPLHDNNLFSLYLVLPFLGCSMALLRHNWYPSKVFVGDTYCYFAGMTFAVAGILGHNTKTMLLFFLPQLINFVYSLPQLFRLIPCPRHRMPGYVAKDDTLCNSYAEVEPAALGHGGKVVLALCERLRLAHVVHTPGQSVVKVSNLTIINYALYVLGPMHEARLTTVLLIFQVVCNGLALLVRYQLAGLFYDIVK
jgi:UDP-N-acetylglucosamine--dolichyl-phosphate N-acetylglucosaminephosphotransferase